MFRCFYNTKSVFLAVNASLRNVVGVYFFASYWSARFGTFPEENDQYTNTAPTTLSAIQAANQSTFINAINAVVISRNDKNKQLTLVSQRKLATARNTLFAL